MGRESMAFSQPISAVNGYRKPKVKREKFFRYGQRAAW
jgi:hypothetical protein